MKIIKPYLFHILILALFIFIVSPTLFSNGMFMDGVFYATIANNLAHNIGEFWGLRFTDTFNYHFYGHPPLAMGIQSVFFRLFGDSFLVERWYSFLTAIISAWLIILIWKELLVDTLKKMSYLPLFFLLSVPVFTWSISNNMLENTMMIFIISSSLLFIKSLKNKHFFFLFLSALMLFLAFLTKGLIALFPFSMTLSALFFLPRYSVKRFLTDTLFLLLSFFSLLSLLFIVQTKSLDFFQDYFQEQLLGSLKNVITVSHRYFIVVKLFKELLPMIVLTILIFFFTRTKTKILTYRSWILWFLFVAFTGVLPVMISLKQSGFYILAVYPFFSIALALLLAPRILERTKNIHLTNRSTYILTVFSLVLLFSSVVSIFVFSQKIGRDKEKIEDVRKISKHINSQAIITIEKSLQTDWSLYGYFYRYAGISLTKEKKQFYLLIKKGHSPILKKQYRKMPVSLHLFDLYQKIDK